MRLYSYTDQSHFLNPVKYGQINTTAFVGTSSTTAAKYSIVKYAVQSQDAIKYDIDVVNFGF